MKTFDVLMLNKLFKKNNFNVIPEIKYAKISSTLEVCSPVLKYVVTVIINKYF